MKYYPSRKSQKLGRGSLSSPPPHLLPWPGVFQKEWVQGPCPFLSLKGGCPWKPHLVSGFLWRWCCDLQLVLCLMGEDVMPLSVPESGECAGQDAGHSERKGPCISQALLAQLACEVSGSLFPSWFHTGKEETQGHDYFLQPPWQVTFPGTSPI